MIPGALLAAGAPLSPTADQARELARAELADPAYAAARPGLVQRLVSAVLDALSQLRVPQGSSVLQGVAALVLAAVVLVVVVLVVRRTGLPGRARPGAAPVLAGPASADELRRAADAAAAAGAWEEACAQRFRAVVRALQDRDLVPTAPGLTASEAAGAAAAALPGRAGAVREGAALFDGVVYGGLRAGRDDDARLVALDADLARERPAGGEPAVVLDSAGQPAGGR